MITPAALTPRCWPDSRQLRQRGALVWTLIERDLKLRYRRSWLGFLWSQLAPLSMLAVLWLVFGHVIRLHIPHYPLYVFVGLLGWTWFSGSLTAATTCVVDSRDLVGRLTLPLPLLPVVAVGAQLLNLLLALPFVIVLAALLLGGVGAPILALPLVLVAQGLLIMGPAYVLSSLHVRFRDVGHLVGVTLLPLFYLTPVFYSSRELPRHWQPLFRLNPLSWLLTDYRGVLLAGRWPGWAALGVLLALGVAGTLVGYQVFVRRGALIADEL